MLTALTVAISVLAAVAGESVRALVLLTPASVLSDATVWTALTYGFVATDPLGVIFGALILLTVGEVLETMWGSRRFAVFALGVTALAAAATVLLSLVWTGLRPLSYPGSTVMTGALWVAYGLAFGTRTTGFWGLPVTGNQFALIGVGFVGLNAAFAGLSVVVPSVFALGLTYLAARGFGPGDLFVRFRSWQLNRQLKKRASHLSVVSGEKRNMPSDSDKYLH